MFVAVSELFYTNCGMNFNRNGFLFRRLTDRSVYDMFIKTNCYGGDCVDGAGYRDVGEKTINTREREEDENQ